MQRFLPPFVLICALLPRAALAQRPFPSEWPTGSQEYRSLDGSLLVRADYGKRTLALLDAKTDEARWSRPLEGDLVARVIVDESGWVVVTDGIAFFTVLRNSDGSTVGTVPVIDQFSPDDRARYVRQVTDRPPRWEQCSLWGFRNVDGAVYFTVRAWWGHRIVYDCEHAALLKDGALGEKIDTIDRARVLSGLQKAAAGERPKDDDHSAWPRVYQAMTFAYWAGVMKIAEAREALRQLEAWEYYDVASGWGEGVRQNSEPPTPLSWRESRLRQCVQLSLRRIGEAPRPLPAYRFFFHNGLGESRQPYVPPDSDLPRTARARKIKAGMSGREVLDILGSPDLLAYERGIGTERWEYDLDPPDPCTFYVAWDGIKVRDAFEIKPPVWQNSRDRDERLMR